ncbi:Cyclin, N-terminal domain [Ceratobasidium sp. AG-Ba]|nr:Cyclin, N-terminal domain [Ceratobasidium sp. AG-Ba]
MADEQAAFWEQLELPSNEVCLPQPYWIDIQTQTQDYNVRIDPRSAHELQSFLDMDDSEDGNTEPTTGHSAFSDCDSDEETDDDDLSMRTQSSPTTDSSSLPSPSACLASVGHSFWDDEPQSGDDYWDRQNATLCAKHIRDAFPDATPRGALPLERFIADVLKQTRDSVRDDLAFVALQFLKRVAPSCPLGYYEDMFFTSLILADKMESDSSHSLRWWSIHSRKLWTVDELRDMERRMLQSLDWDLSTSINCRSSYQSYLAGLTSSTSSSS